MLSLWFVSIYFTSQLVTFILQVFFIFIHHLSCQDMCLHILSDIATLLLILHLYIYCVTYTFLYQIITCRCAFVLFYDNGWTANVRTELMLDPSRSPNTTHQVCWSAILNKCQIIVHVPFFGSTLHINAYPLAGVSFRMYCTNTHKVKVKAALASGKADLGSAWICRRSRAA